MLQITSPHDLSIIKEIPLVGKVEVEKALSKAYSLFQNQSKWIPAHERISILKISTLYKMQSKKNSLPYNN